ncbi:MAG: serine hydrolase domain-containing protein [Flavobacteriaceae bacterium]|nr:serine hydrolase domain-containing protein [Flavobacteriaceae bacterium]
MKKFYLIAFLITSSIYSQSKFQFRDGVDCIAGKTVEYSDEPGYALAVFTNEQMLYTKASGLKNLKTDSQITLDTPFNIASCAKTFTSAAILKLSEEGQLSLDHSVRLYLKDFPHNFKDIKLINLLNHSSGLTDYTDEEDWRSRIKTNQDVLNLVQRQDSLNFEPGTKFKYNNTAYVLLAEIVEKVSEQSFEEYVRNHFLIPLQLNNTYFPNEILIEERSVGYTKEENDTLFKRDDTEEYLVTGSTGMYSSVNDLVKWLRAFDKSTIITPYMKQLMLTYPTLPNGKKGYMNMGWFNETMGSRNPSLEGFEQDGQVGVTAGFRSYLIKSKNHDFNYIVLSNRGTLPFQFIGYELIDCFFDRKD